jgi:hypothetical protein
MEAEIQEQSQVETSSKLSQKDAVYTFVTEALGSHNIDEGQKLKDRRSSWRLP